MKYLEQLDGESLVKSFFETGNLRLKEKIVVSFAPLVKHIAGRFNLKFSTTLAQEDLYQAGVFGLLKALERFKPDVGTPFKAYAYKRIYGEIVDTMRKEGMLGRDKYDQIKKLEQAVRDLTNMNGYEPSTDEICNYLHISEDEYFSLVDTAQLIYTTSLNTKVSGEEGEFIYRIDTLKDDDSLTPEDALIRQDLKRRLKEVINELPERKKLIMALYYYEELTLADIGRVIDLTEARISQILNKTLIEIKAKLDQ